MALPGGLGFGGVRGVFPREYARSGHYGVFYLQNLKVSSLQFLKYSVSKVAYFASKPKSSVLRREYERLRYHGVFYLVFSKVSTLRNL